MYVMPTLNIFLSMSPMSHSLSTLGSAHRTQTGRMRRTKYDSRNDEHISVNSILGRTFDNLKLDMNTNEKQCIALLCNDMTGTGYRKCWMENAENMFDAAQFNEKHTQFRQWEQLIALYRVRCMSIIVIWRPPIFVSSAQFSPSYNTINEVEALTPIKSYAQSPSVYIVKRKG